ncbi:hypothetical protein D081_2229 [Anaerovibrio sp. JC8]|uniref:hypothetical protein n=1 Tax=Anaerovibrio sp. JC8 TaxID=1240085 RepID=UPI000A0C73CC|nr:hypothetical protein [Anaerovibrio sp. JC8]ORT99050.1 hypothetical protein D081_2229 [Anaerovibrio sp. JC8]
MTRFQKDKQEILAGNSREVMAGRKEELRKLEKQLRECRNGFRAQCLQQEIERRRREYNELDEMI